MGLDEGWIGSGMAAVYISSHLAQCVDYYIQRDGETVLSKLPPCKGVLQSLYFDLVSGTTLDET